MASLLNLIFLVPAVGFLGELVRVRMQTPVDEQAGFVAYEDRMLLGGIFGALLPALLNGSLLVLLGVLAVLAAEAYVVMSTDSAMLALVPTPGFRAKTISDHQNMVIGLALGGAFIGFLVSLIFGALMNGIAGLF